MKHKHQIWGPLLIIGLLLVPTLTGADAQSAGTLFIIRVDGPIGPGVADFVQSSLNEATLQGGLGLVIELDTPGGLAESMRSIVKTIVNSPIPVIVFVSPSGAHAASAGVLITLAADVAVMAPGTNIGAAHPVAAAGQEIEGPMADKVTNDMVASAMAIASQRGRNTEWVEKAVRESASVTAKEALELNVIDFMADDLEDLIAQLDGREIAGKGTLQLATAQTQRIDEGMRTRILKALSDPNIAYLLLMIGLAGLYFELSHPGTIFPGVVGAIAIVLAAFALQTLPVNYAGVLLIALAVVFFILELKITSYGMLSVAGVVSLLLGSLMLFESGDEAEALQLSLKVVLPTVAMISAFFIFVAGLVFRSHLIKPRTGEQGMIGQVGVIKERIDGEGRVMVRGELWRAVADEPIAAGAAVIVAGIEGLVLTVKPHNDAAAEKGGSA
jgi:membrane-bound serine protease (ClpP class)